MSYQLISQFQPKGDQPQAIAQLLNGLEKQEKYQTLLGVTGSGKTFTMANIIAKSNKPALIISHNKTLAAQLAAEFREFFPKNEVHYFVSFYDYYQPEAYIPRTDTYIEKDSDINDEIDRLRHATTQALLSTKNVIIVASVSCIYSLGSPDEYQGASLELKINHTYNRKKLFTSLIKNNYQRNNFTFKRGIFSVKGEIIEIYPAMADNFTYRLFFNGELLEKIEKNNLFDQSKNINLENIFIYPASHYVIPKDYIKNAIANIKTDLKKEVAQFKKQDKLLEAQRLQERTSYDLEMIEQTGYVNGIENYSRYFDNRKPGQEPFTLLDFFPKDYLLFVDESHITIPQIRGMYAGDQARKQNLINYGWRLAACRDNRPLQYAEFQNKINQAIFVSATPSPENLKLSSSVVQQLIRPTGLLDPQITIKPTKNQVDYLIQEIKIRTQKKQRVLVTTLTKRLAEELTDYLKEQKIAVQYLHSDVDTLERLEIIRDLRTGVFDVLIGINLLREGLDLPEVSLVAILDADKESFLRDERSLMQIMGRASRHQEGHVIMFADQITKSMKAAITETQRRKKIQEEYNKKNHIIPQSIKKNIGQDRLSGIKLDKPEFLPSDLIKKMPRAEIKNLINDINKQMQIASQNLEFERAAQLRDQIKALKKI